MSPRDAGKPDPLGNGAKPRGNPSIARGMTVGREPIHELNLGGGRIPPSGPPTALASGPDASSLFKAFQRRWLLAVSLGLLFAAGAAVAACILLTPKYTVAALLHVSHQSTFLPSQMGDPRDGQIMSTAAALVKRSDVLLQALGTPEVKQTPYVNEHAEPLYKLGEDLRVERQDGSPLIKVSMLGDNPAELITLVNAVANAWYKQASAEERDRQSESVRGLEKFATDTNAEVERYRNTLHQRERELGYVDPKNASDKHEPLLDRFRSTQNAYTDVALKLMSAKTALDAHQQRAKSIDTRPIPPSVIEREFEADPQIRELMAEQMKQQRRVDYLLGVGHFPDSPVVRAPKALLDATKKQIEDHKAELRPKLEERYRQEARMKFDQEGAVLEDQANGLAQQELALRKEISQLQTVSKESGNSFTELEILRSKIETGQKMADFATDLWKKAQADVGRPLRVAIYQEATLQKRDIKRQVIGTVGSPIAVFFGVCLCVSWWEFRARRIHSADEVVRDLGMRLVGAVPAMPTAGDAFFNPDKGPDAAGERMLESIDSIRTVLLRDASVAATRVVMVTSATAGEGKTTLAGHLASSLARAGRRTLLVDGDLRTPAAHQLLEQTLQPGLSEVLLEEINLAEAVRPATAVDGLWLLPAGQWDREVLHALAQDGPQRIFEQLREEFDFIIVDSHPVLAATDALLLGQHADAVIFSVLRDVSQMPPVSAAAQRLASLGIRVLGAVVNGVDPEDLYKHGPVLTKPTGSQPWA